MTNTKQSKKESPKAKKIRLEGEISSLEQTIENFKKVASKLEATIGKLEATIGKLETTTEKLKPKVDEVTRLAGENETALKIVTDVQLPSIREKSEIIDGKLKEFEEKKEDGINAINKTRGCMREQSEKAEKFLEQIKEIMPIAGTSKLARFFCAAKNQYGRNIDPNTYTSE